MADKIKKNMKSGKPNGDFGGGRNRSFGGGGPQNIPRPLKVSLREAEGKKAEGTKTP